MKNKELLVRSIQVLKEYTDETDDGILDEYTLNEIDQKKLLYKYSDPVDNINDIRHINIDYTVDLILEKINR